MRIGYCTTDVSRGLIAQITGSHTYHAATYLSADVLNKYVGDKIESIEFAISPKRGHMAEYFNLYRSEGYAWNHISTRSNS